MGVQAFLSQKDNLAASATLTPSSVKPIANAVMLVLRNWSGRGRTVISGTYTGQNEQTIELKTVDTVATDNPMVSEPEFIGVGNGTLTGATVSAAQTITVTLSSLGEQLKAAGLNMGAVVFKSRALGVSGNSITLTVNESGLTYTAANFSTLRRIQSGTDLVNGPEYDWQSAVMGTDDIVPASAKRIRFGDDDNTIYRQVKQFNGKQWDYRFMPPLKRDIEAGTPIYFVTGSRSVTVSNGTTTETFTGIQTLFDLVKKIQTGSTLITVDGVVAEDHGLDGIATLEFDLKTSAYAEPSFGSGSKYAQRFTSVSVGSNASTELIQAKCFAISRDENPSAGLGKELWTLSGTVSGALGNIQTGTAYTHPSGKFGLTIPAKYPDGWGSKRGKLTQQSMKVSTSVVVDNLFAGAEATDQTITLTWKIPGTDGQPDNNAAGCGSSGMTSGTVDYARLGLTALPTPNSGGATGGSGGGGAAAQTVDDFYFSWNSAKGRVPYNQQPNLGVLKISGSSLFTGYVMNQISDINVIDIKVYNPSGTLLTQGVDYNLIYTDSVYFYNGGNATWIELLTPDCFSTYTQPTFNVPIYLDSGGVWRVNRELFHEVTGTFTPAQNVADGWTSAFLGTTVPTYSGTAYNYDANLHVHLVSAGASSSGSVLAGSFWEVKGSAGTAYDSAAANGIYYSAAGGVDTHEFAFELHCKCPEFLKSGDTITLAIKDAKWPPTYQVGDELFLPTVAATPLQLAGGHDGDNVQTWLVESSTQGGMAAYSLDTDTPTPYSSGGVSFQITPGTVPFSEGDKFTFAVEGGHWQYRIDGGSWSATQVISATPYSIGNGLSVAYNTGASPSFAVNDLSKYTCFQPAAVSHVTTPARDVWKWSGASATLVLDFGSSKDFDAVALARVVLNGGTVTVSTSADNVTYSTPVAIDIYNQIGVHLYSGLQSFRYVKIAVSGATGGHIGWVYVGERFSSELNADVTLSDKYDMIRGQDSMAASWVTTRPSCKAEWSEAALSADEAQELMSIISRSKTNGDEPFLFLPNIARPQDARLVVVNGDAPEYKDLSSEQALDGTKRRYSMTINLEGAA